jgi:hypothetical protein
MQSHSKYSLLLCELHHPQLHGKTNDSEPNIEYHYLVNEVFNVVDMFDGFTLNHCIKHLKNHYKLLKLNVMDIHPGIRNYNSIISNINYIKPEIAEYIILPTQEAIAILKTFWLRIIQKKWKKVFQ